MRPFPNDVLLTLRTQLIKIGDIMLRILLLSILVGIPSFLNAQIDLDAYKQYMQSHQDIRYEELLDEFDVGTFDRYCPTDYSQAYYFDSTNQFMNFTPDELQLLSENGFVVTERKEVENFIKGYYNIYVNDLPVYISSDLFNHALFYTMTNYLKTTETFAIQERLTAILRQCLYYYYSNESKKLADTTLPADYIKAFRDLGLVIYVAAEMRRSYPKNRNMPYYNGSADTTAYNAVFDKIAVALSAHENGVDYNYLQEIHFPSGRIDTMDISQFMPRGHYDTDELREYFMSMMWLSRVFMTIPEKEESLEASKYEVIMSGIFRDIMEEMNLRDLYNQLDSIFTFLIANQENLTINEVDIAYDSLGVSSMIEVLEQDLLWEYCQILRSTEKGIQSYNTQVVKGMDFESDGQSPQYFSILGQRPILDGFVLGNVVYPMIKDESSLEPIRRMLPNSMDVLFALGNDAAAHIARNDIQKYLYADNLAACRYVFDNINERDWNSSIYNLWTKALLALNPPKERDDLPKFMQAAGWQHKNMTTQLASWAELRHLTVLYAKQSFSGIPICDFPDFFIEPRPDYFKALVELNEKLIEFHQLIYPDGGRQYFGYDIEEMFEKKTVIFDNLEEFSRRQYAGEEYTAEQIEFIKKMIFENDGTCIHDNIVVQGWIYDLFHIGEDVIPYNQKEVGENLKPTKVTTDVHTSPSDEFENIVGWVKHAATGDQNYCTIVTDNCNGKPTAYTGVVNSYYEYVTENFQRDTDDEWLAKMDQIPAPSFTNVYRANKDGYKMPLAELVKTHDVSVEDENTSESYSIGIYPNVFEDEFTIAVNSTENYAGTARISMYSSTGELIFDAEYNSLPNGQVVLNPADYGLANLTSGVYIIELKIGEKVYSGKAIKIK